MKTIRGRFGILFGGFVLLVLISAATMIWGLETERQDGLIINLAGRQRMLIQSMARLAFINGLEEPANIAALQDAEQTFDNTLLALRDGGSVPYLPGTNVTLPPTRDSGIRTALDQTISSWNEFRVLLDSLQRTSNNDPTYAGILQSIELKSDALTDQADTVVNLYQTNGTTRVNRLRMAQILFLATALLLLGAGALVTRNSVLKPLRELGKAVARLGENDLDSSIATQGPEEIRALSQAFASMRLNLRSSREELVLMNSSLEDRIRKRTHELEMLNEISREISSRLDIQQVLDSVTQKARTLLDGEVASLCLVDEQRHWLKLQAISGPADAVNGGAVPAGEGLTGMVLEGDQAMLCGAGQCQGGCRMLSDPYRVSHMAAPLRIGDRVIGALCVGSVTTGRFAEESVVLLTKLANTAAIALENARLYTQIERVATLEERHRVAAEMHDGLGQTLSYLGLMTDQVVEFLSAGQDQAALERLERTRGSISQATTELRRAINSLMDETGPAPDLCTRLREVVEEISGEGNLPIAWQSETESVPACPPSVADQVLNVTREALQNVIRHAHAQHAVVRLGKVDTHYFVRIEDDGMGFDASQPGPRGHFGLQIMQARAARIGGKAQIVSAPGCGTQVTLTWPIEAGA